MNKEEVYKDFEKRDYNGIRWLIKTGKCKGIKTVEGWRVYKLLDKYFAICPFQSTDLHNSFEEIKDILEAD